MSEPKLPSTITIITAVYLGGHGIKNHPNYLTRMQMSELCEKWLLAKSASRQIPPLDSPKE